MSPVPDDEEAGIVLIQAVSVCPVVNPVMTGSVQDQLQRAQVGHQLGVDPELVEQVQLLVDQRLAGWDEESQGEIERLEISTILRCPGQHLHHQPSYHAAKALES